MKRSLLVAAAIAALPLLAQEQEPRKPFLYRHNYYATFGAGACQHGYTNISVGGGAEGFLVYGLAAGAEMSYHQFVNDVSYVAGSANLGYHFVDRKSPKKVDPFAVIGIGFGLHTEGGFAPASSLGGGLTYWFKPTMGIRTEFRLHSVAEEVVPMFRIGISFR